MKTKPSILAFVAAVTMVACSAHAPSVEGVATEQARVGMQPFVVGYHKLPPGESPFGVVRGFDNYMWFTQSIPNGDIGRMTRAGVVTEYSVPGGRDGECIVRGSSDHLWFASNQGRFVGRVDTNGTVTTYTATGIAPYCVAIGRDRNIWFTDTANVAIGRLSPTTGQIVEFKLANSNSLPVMLDLGSDGNIWFTDNGIGAVGKVTTAGVITEYALPNGPNSKPYGIAVGPDGANYVGEVLSSAIAQVETDGSITEFGGITVGPQGMAEGPDKKTVWFADASTISRFNVTSHAVQAIGDAPNAADVEMMSVGPGRVMWFTATGLKPKQNYLGVVASR
jgi:virginiamycin B lyase